MTRGLLQNTREPELVIVSLGGCEVAAYDHGGTGHPIILVHGGGRDSADWLEVAAALVAEHRVVAFDLRGHGLSSSMGLDWSFDEATSHIDVVAEAFRMRAPLVVGHSLGGLVATLYATRHPGCPGVMNVDGVGVAVPRRFPGPDAARDSVTVRAFVSSMLPRVGELDPLGEAVAGLNVFRLLRVAVCPVEFVVATGGPDDPPELRLWRAATLNEVTLLARKRPAISVSTVDSGRLVPTQRPHELAALIRKFATRAISRRRPSAAC